MAAKNHKPKKTICGSEESYYKQERNKMKQNKDKFRN